MKWLGWTLLAVLALGCRRVPPAELAQSVEVLSVSLAFPKADQGELFFEVALPPNVPRVGALRWELYLGAKRFAEGVAMNPELGTTAGGRRFLRVEAPLVFHHLGWREGGTWLSVGLRGELQPLGGDQRYSFQRRTEQLVTAAPVLDESGE